MSQYFTPAIPATQNVMEIEFKPTYLYIKQHAITGKLYFGKTIRDVEKYCGSGTHWVKHIKKHGKEHVVTLWYELFTDKNNIKQFALLFSKEMNIVESKQWLNLKLEDGLDGGTMPGKNSINFGRKHSAEIRLARSKSISGENHPNFGKNTQKKQY